MHKYTSVLICYDSTVNTEEIAAKILKLKINNEPIIIAIEGFGGSGKSTLAAKLAKGLKDVYVINIDDFIIKDKISDPIKSNFDRQRLKKQVLLPLKNNSTARYQRLIWQTNKLSEYITVPKTKFLIIEGVSTFHPDIADYMDYKIWVETPSEVAQKRGSERDKALGSDNDQLWDHWTSTYKEYNAQFKPEEQADVIFDNSN